MTATEYHTDWRRAGACLTADPDMFFPVSPTGLGLEQVSAARQVCGRCEVRQQCLDHALSTRQVYGIWGGTTPDERLAMLRRRTARARKRTRP